MRSWRLTRGLTDHLNSFVKLFVNQASDIP
jgi:hypothetical protein